MWWRTRHGRGPPARHHLLEQLPGPAEHPCRVPLVLRIPLAPLLSHVLVSTPTNVAGRSPSDDQVRHKTPGHTRRRPRFRGAAPISMFVRTLDIHQSPITNHQSCEERAPACTPLDVKLLSPRAPSSDIAWRCRCDGCPLRDVPDHVVAGIDARSSRLGLSRSEYLRRRLAQEG